MNEVLPQELLALSNAHRALAQAKTIEQVREIRDKAEAARKYARCALLGLKTQNDCAEIKLRAERKAGKLLAELRLSSGRPKKKRSHDETILADLGINKNQSSRWQMEAAVSEKLFQIYLALAREEGKELTAQGLLRLAHRRQEAAVSGQTETRPRRRHNQASQFVVANTCSSSSNNGNPATDEPGELVAELINQRQLLADLLTEFCCKEVIRSELIQRRMVARLLADMEDLLGKLAGPLHCKAHIHATKAVPTASSCYLHGGRTRRSFVADGDTG